MTDSNDNSGRGQPPRLRARSGQTWLAEPENQTQVELRQALDQAAAREADEVTLRRVWGRLAQLPDLVPTERESNWATFLAPRRARWPWIGAASLAGAAVAMVLMLLGNPAAKHFGAGGIPAQPTAPPVAVKREGDRSVLVAPATVRTGRGETLRLALRGGTEVTVTSESTLVLDENNRPTVSTGEVQFHVPPQPAGRTFAVSAGSYRVVVVGTRFRVRVNGGNTAVAVDEGIVEVWTDRRIARLTVGESWVSPPATETTAPPVRPAELVVPVKHPVASFRLRRSSHAARVSLNSGMGVAVNGSSGGSLAASGGRDSSFSASSTAGLIGLPDSGAGAPGAPGAASSAVAGSPTESSPPPPAAPGTTPAVASLIVQARAARSSGEPRKALELYRALAQRGGAAGENAEYEIGRVLRDGLGQPREAIAAWRAYRAQHPRGLLRTEADVSVIETLVAVNDRAGALGEASDFVRRYPDSERRVEIGGLAGDLLREKGDCDGALTAYDGALGSGRGRREIVDGVSFHRSVCLLHGDRSAGLASLRAYLQTFPVGRFRAEAERLLTEHARALAARRP